jgi:hypothetical protein
MKKIEVFDPSLAVILPATNWGGWIGGNAGNALFTTQLAELVAIGAAIASKL